MDRDIAIGGLPHKVISFKDKPKLIDKKNFEWKIEVNQEDIVAITEELTMSKKISEEHEIKILNPDAIEDLIIVLHFAVKQP